jgi:8-oxo-dGTP diphosphatase
MKLLATLRDQDFDANAPKVDHSDYFHRHAARAVVLDGAKVALLKVTKHDYHKLPGGGIENDEDQPTAVKREAMEELGCHIEVIAEVCRIEEFRDGEQLHQSSYCFIAAKSGESEAPAFTEHELDEGFEIVWADTIDDAIKLVLSSSPTNYEGNFIMRRDSMLLKEAKTLLPSADTLNNLK